MENKQLEKKLVIANEKMYEAKKAGKNVIVCDFF